MSYYYYYFCSCSSQSLSSTSGPSSAPQQKGKEGVDSETLEVRTPPKGKKKKKERNGAQQREQNCFSFIYSARLVHFPHFTCLQELHTRQLPVLVSAVHSDDSSTVLYNTLSVYLILSGMWLWSARIRTRSREILKHTRCTWTWWGGSARHYWRWDRSTSRYIMMFRRDQIN